MHHAHSNPEQARTERSFSKHNTLRCFFCAVTLLAMLVVALLPTAGARAQDAQTTPTQTATANPPTAETAVVLTDTPADTPPATPEATQDLITSPDPTATQDLANLTSTPTSTGQVPAAPLEAASLTATLSSTPPADAGLAGPVQAQASPVCPSDQKKASVKLDGITLSICAPVLPGDFIIPDPASSDQIATAATLNPFQEFSITAIAYGLKVSTETLPAAAAGLAGEYLQDLRDARIAEGGQVKDGPAASMFGRSVSSLASLVSVKIHGDTPSDVVVVEWVADAGQRLWIIRYSQEVTAAANQPADEAIDPIIQLLSQVVVSSPDIANPSTSAKYFAAPNPPPVPGITAQAAGDLPFPSWWSGDCDKNNFPGSYPLGGIYRNVKACGPINTQRVVRFAPGLWGELEWQCVELSMRFLYLAYHILPYPGNGKDVVWNYTPKSSDEVTLVKISNSTEGKAPQAGDVLSYGTTSTYGHTSVVTGSNVDGSGDGTITIIEQNVSNPSNGIETLTVTNWQVRSWMVITGWLHGNNPDPTLSSISPTNVIAGTTGLVLDVFGTNFISSSAVRWNGTSLPTAFVSSTELIAAVPDSYLDTGGTASVTVRNPSPGGGTSSAKTFTINNPIPVLTAISPTTALIAGSSFTLTLTGSDFISTSKVKWNGTSLTTTFVSATQLTATVPSANLKTAGPVNITVANPAPGGSSAVQIFTINYRVPTTSSISPTSALANSANLTLTVNGTYFAPGAIVRWNGADLTTTYASSVKVTAVIPAANLTQAGTVPITVFNPSPGGGTSASRTFTINNPLPSATGLSPDHRTAATGAFSLTVNGAKFVSTSTVRWNGVDLATTFVSPTQLTAQVTAQLAANPGWMNITVYNPPPAGGASDPLTFKVISQTPGVCVSARDIALGASDIFNNGGDGSTNNIDTYPAISWDMHGPEFTYRFDAPQPATVGVYLWDNTANLKTFLVDGGSGSCSAANVLAYGTRFVFNALANHTYYFVVDGYQGAVGDYRIAVNAIIPTDGSQIQTARPVFQWPAIQGAKSYTLQVSTSSSFSSLLINSTTSRTSYAVGTALPSSRQLYWRVKTSTGSYIYLSKGYLGFKTGNPPGLPKLTYPSSNGLLANYIPLLNWSDSTLPAGISLTHYQVQVAFDSDFNNKVIDQTASQSSYQVSAPGFTPDTRYYWRVRAFGSNGDDSNWSSASTFRAGMLPPVLGLPADLGSVLTTRPAFSWNAVDNATSYTIQASTVSSFSSTVVNTSVKALTYTPGSDLPRSRTIYWRVRANGANPSAWSLVFSFFSANPPSVPTMLAPANGASLSIYTPTLDWNDPANAAQYEVQIASASTFAAGTLVAENLSTSPTPSSFTLASPLTPNRTFYWRVRVFNAGLQYSNWSSVRHFHTRLPAPGLISPGSGATATTLPTLNWGPVSEATSYVVQVSTSLSFSSPVISKTVTGTSYTPTSKLAAGKKYYWRVYAKGAVNSTWSAVWDFTTP